ncbi:hypothetical protein [Sphingomonas sp. BE138]|uniref:hypothetical protein n=1 Tax=Sphingomonas sp. BE138 TaxID=2817845 RepID=UPI00286D517D|nr:hypothetical protein [Sphingomonas sp. BE138]
MARGRARIAAMRPVNDAIARAAAAEREATNFAFTDDAVRHGRGDDRDIAILRGREAHGYGWDLANRYADGWYAAHVGWPHHYPDGIPSTTPLAERHAAYDRGFTDGGGDRTDLFDAARRAFTADMRSDNLPPPTVITVTGRPLPSSWPKPSDHPRPARWSRRLLILPAEAVDTDPAWDFLALTQARCGAEAATIVILTPAGFADAARAVREQHNTIPADTAHAQAQLSALLQNREYDDVLVALQGRDLDLLDSIANVLPLARTMERTRNSRLQQRGHLRTWLDRGLAEGQTLAQGHIRWGKAIPFLHASLGEFTARHVGASSGKGHLIRITIGDALAHGFAAPDGTRLSPETPVSSKAKLRPAMAAALRAFAAATPLMATAPLLAA